MSGFFAPDFYFEKYSDVTLDFLKKNNVKTVLLDLDNTIAPYEQETPSEENVAWLDSLKNAGIGYAFISNNSRDERIKRFNEKLCAPAYSKSKKPFAKRNIELALKDLGGKKEEAIFLGDQIFTDVLAGKIYGMRTVLVPPIKDKKNLFFRFKRALEKPILKRYFINIR